MIDGSGDPLKPYRVGRGLETEVGLGKLGKLEWSGAGGAEVMVFPLKFSARFGSGARRPSFVSYRIVCMQSCMLHIQRGMVLFLLCPPGLVGIAKNMQDLITKVPTVAVCSRTDLS